MAYDKINLFCAVRNEADMEKFNTAMNTAEGLLQDAIDAGVTKPELKVTAEFDGFNFTLTGVLPEGTKKENN